MSVSRFERYRIAKAENPSKTRVFSTGTTFAKPGEMKRAITSKEITLIIGILVAVVVAMTLWLTHPLDQSKVQTSTSTGVDPNTVKNVILASFKILF
jgi:hypothetical protein